MTKSKKVSRKNKMSAGKTPDEAPVMYKQIPVMRQNPIHKFRRALTRQFSYNPATGIDASGTYTIQIAFAPGGTNFRLGGISAYTDNVPNSTEFSNLYDQWRLKGILLRMDATQNAFSNSGVAYSPPLVVFAADYDDSGDATANALFEYPQSRTHSFQTNGYAPLICGMSPRPVRDVAGYGVLTSYSPMEECPFIRTAELGTPHYGLKLALQLNGGSVNAVVAYFQVTIWFDMEFVNPK